MADSVLNDDRTAKDIAIAVKSLDHNFAGHYNGGKKYFDLESNSN